MGVTIFRPGQRLVIPGVRVMQTSAPPVSASWWLAGGISDAHCVVAYAAKGAADLAASYINLNNPGTNNAAPGVAPTWDATGGWTFNGSTQYLMAAPVLNQTYSAIVRYSNLTAATNKTFFGGYNDSGGGAGALVMQCDINTIMGYWNGTTAVHAEGSMFTSGVHAVAGKSVYVDGAAAYTIPAGSFSGSIQTTIGGLWYQNSSIINLAAVKVQAVAIYNITLSGGQVSALTAAMSAL